MQDALWVQLPQQMLEQEKKVLLQLLQQQQKVKWCKIVLEIYISLLADVIKIETKLGIFLSLTVMKDLLD